MLSTILLFIFNFEGNIDVSFMQSCSCLYCTVSRQRFPNNKQKPCGSGSGKGVQCCFLARLSETKVTVQTLTPSMVSNTLNN